MSYSTTSSLVNRENQKATITGIIDSTVVLQKPTRATANQPQPERLLGLEMHGVGGIGKSRILDEVKKQCREKGLPFVGVDLLVLGQEDIKLQQQDLLIRLFDQLDHYYPQVSVARSRLIQLARATGQETADAARDTSEALSELLKELSRAGKKEPLIMLFDSIEQCSDELFDWIGKQLLGQFIAEEDQSPIRVFLAGRGARVFDSSWPQTIKRVIRSLRLDPLAFEATEEHLAALPPDGLYKKAAKDIHHLSIGHPYSTQALTHWLDMLGIKPNDVKAKRESLASRLYDEVLKRYILADASEWTLPLAEIACVPRRFDAGMLADLVKRHRPDLASNEPIQWYIARLVDLQQSPLHLIYLDQGGPAYRLEPTFRKLLHTTLAVLKPTELVAMHRTARSIWEQAGDSLPALAAGATQELIYHVAEITLLEGGDASQATNAALEQILPTRFNPRETEGLKQVTLLKDALVSDGGLIELLTKSVVEQLAKHIEGFTSPPPMPTSTFEASFLVIEHTPPTTYRVSWYRTGHAIQPTETIYSNRLYKVADWRSRTQDIGKAAFRSYLPGRTQDFLKRIAPNWAIELSTDWADVPWELLHDGEEFLCLSRPIGRKPKLLKEPREHPLSDKQMPQALVVGDPTGDLTGAAEEARAVAELLTRSGFSVDVLIGRQHATANEFSIQLASDKRYSIIHYAGHGYFDELRPEQSGLQFVDGPYYAEELERGLNSRAFIFLSACSAAQTKTSEAGPGFQGRFIEGIAIAALVGGASSCLAPMWEIEDSATQEFALEFYRQLLGGIPVGEAVRRARLAVRSNVSDDCACGDTTRHLKHTELAPVRSKNIDNWAPWVLYGNPLSTIPTRTGNPQKL